MHVPFVDLGIQYEKLRHELLENIESVCTGSRFILGKDVEDFEDEFASYIGSRFAIGVASGTDALHLSLRSLGIGPGDEVITVANTFVATVTAIWQSGARPVLVDCLPDSYTVDPKAVEHAITHRTRAIIPVHLYGQPANMGPLISMAKEHGLKIVEDACQAHGACYKGRRVGILGDVGCFSFYPGKNLGAYGDGGAVVTNDTHVAENIRALRDYGQKVKSQHVLKGFNSRLDGIQAAILGVKLRYLDSWNKDRIRHAEQYCQRLRGCSKIILPVTKNDSDEDDDTLTHVFHLFVVRVRNRDVVVKKLKEVGIATGIHYPVPIHLHESFSDLKMGPGSFPVAEQCAQEILSLPMYPELTESQIEWVCTNLLSALH